MAVQGQENLENLGLHRQARILYLRKISEVFYYDQWNLLEPEVGVSSKYEHLKIATPLSDSGYIRTPAFMQEPERREGEPTLLIPYASTYADDRRHDD
jgi:hypothetical protein